MGSLVGSRILLCYMADCRSCFGVLLRLDKSIILPSVSAMIYPSYFVARTGWFHVKCSVLFQVFFEVELLLARLHISQMIIGRSIIDCSSFVGRLGLLPRAVP